MSVSTHETVPFRRSPPGVDGYAPEVVGALMLRWQKLRSRQTARCRGARHSLSDGSPRFSNRLLLSEDPLYLEHAHDPFDWQIFGPSAFDDARRSGRPVLLWVVDSRSSVDRGVWERVFCDADLARGVNRAYVPVLLRRGGNVEEVERCLSAAELLSGQRGESTVLWLTPSRAPYAAWTAAADTWRAGENVDALLALLQRHSELPEQASIERCASGSRPGCGGMSSVFVGVDRDRLEAILTAAAECLPAHWRTYLGQPGDRGSLSPALLRFAMRHGDRAGRPELLRWTQDRLEGLQQGTGRDHLRGGQFQDWQGPGRLPLSFDKELEHNADLALCFLEAWELTGHREMFWASEEILGLAWSELRSEFGAFHAALRHPSEGSASLRGIGWTRDELRAVLGVGLYEVVLPSLGLWDIGGARLLVTLPPSRDISEQNGVRRKHIERARKLLAERSERVAASRVDPRVLPGANGMIVASLARTARNLDHIGPDARTWLETAERAAESVTKLLWHRGRLHEAFQRGTRQPAQAGFLAHVKLALGFLELFESTGEVSWLRMCLALEDALPGLWPGQPSAEPDPVVTSLRHRLDEHGRAEDTAAWCLLLARLATLLSDPQRRSRAMTLLRPWFSRLEEDPLGYPSLLAAAERVLAEPQVLLVWSHDDAARRAAFLSVLRGVGSPGREVVVTSDDCDLDALPMRLPIAAHRRRSEERAAAYVCGSQACSPGLETPYALRRFLVGDEKPFGDPRAA